MGAREPARAEAGGQLVTGAADLPHVIAGQSLPEEYTRVVEAYLRERDLPLAGRRFTAAVVNEAVDWWNALEPKSEAD